MNKFTKTLTASNSTIKAQRAKNISESASSEQTKLVLDLEEKIRFLKHK